jgi:NTP pyrophosphatase (non-canonical NTP hydrolase)
MTEIDSIRELTAQIREFAVERDWEKFHDPKSLILALVGEVGELAELFQWIPADGALEEFTKPERKQRASEEISDVLIYLLRLADVLGVELASSAWQKLSESRSRFPASEFDGTAPMKP